MKADNRQASDVHRPGENMMSLDANDPLKFYLRELGSVRPLTRDEETDLLQHVRTQDEQAESGRAARTQTQ